jgi:hypothetical protein
MRISFDIDDTLVCTHPDARHEPDRVRWWLRPWIHEPLRLGAAELLTELAREHELWVYTTSYRHPWNLSWWLWCYGARIHTVVNQHRHERMFGRAGRSKYPAAFGIDLHIDDSWGVWLENKFERNVCVVSPTDPDWTDAVRDAIARVERGEGQPEPPDLPIECRPLRRRW